MSFKYSKRIVTDGWQSCSSFRSVSTTARKVKGIFGQPDPASILPVALGDSPLSHIFRADPTNCGDWWSLPAHYFTFPQHDTVIDINDYSPQAPFRGVAIIGGGGLVGPAFKQLEDLVRRPDVRCIGWGLGNNMVDDKRSRYVASTAPLPDYIEHFELLGVRDFVEELRWVPCASCMHPLLSKHYDIRHDIVVFEHKRLPISINGFPRLSNSGNDIKAILEFLGSGEIVLTNSFHGAYWATLLGRKCIAFPFSSKFYGLKHKVPLCRESEWRDFIPKAVVYDSALSECRRANIEFYRDVTSLLG